MLGLGEEIGGDDSRIGRVVGNDEDFARTGDAVDVDRAENEAFCARNVHVARAHDLVDARNGGCAIRERRDGLGAAGVHDRAHAGEVRGGVDRVVRGVPGQRRGEQDFTDAGDLGGDRAHEDARRVARLSAGRVHAGAGDGRDTNAEGDAVLRVAKPRVPLVLVEGANAGRGENERLAGLLGKAPKCGRAGIVTYEQARCAAAIEALGVPVHGVIALGANVGQNRADDLLDAGKIRLTAGDDQSEGVRKIGGAFNVGREHEGAKGVARVLAILPQGPRLGGA